MLTEIWEAVAPHLLELFGALLTLLFGWLSVQLKAKWGIEVEARHREALHSALMTGAQLALDRKLTGKAAADLAVGYARKSVPDAIGALIADDGILRNLAEAKLRQIVGAAR